MKKTHSKGIASTLIKKVINNSHKATMMLKFTHPTLIKKDKLTMVETKILDKKTTKKNKNRNKNKNTDQINLDLKV
jgi:hypothetical protein